MTDKIKYVTSGKPINVNFFGRTFRAGRIRQNDYNNRLITLTVITLAGFRSTQVTMIFLASNVIKETVSLLSIFHFATLDPFRSQSYKTILALKMSKFVLNCVTVRYANYGHVSNLTTIEVTHPQQI